MIFATTKMPITDKDEAQLAFNGNTPLTLHIRNHPYETTTILEQSLREANLMLPNITKDTKLTKAIFCMQDKLEYYKLHNPDKTFVLQADLQKKSHTFIFDIENPSDCDLIPDTFKTAEDVIAVFKLIFDTFIIIPSYNNGIKGTDYRCHVIVPFDQVHSKELMNNYLVRRLAELTDMYEVETPDMHLLRRVRVGQTAKSQTVQYNILDKGVTTQLTGKFFNDTSREPITYPYSGAKVNKLSSTSNQHTQQPTFKRVKGYSTQMVDHLIVKRGVDKEDINKLRKSVEAAERGEMLLTEELYSPQTGFITVEEIIANGVAGDYNWTNEGSRLPIYYMTYTQQFMEFTQSRKIYKVVQPSKLQIDDITISCKVGDKHYKQPIDIHNLPSRDNIELAPTGMGKTAQLRDKSLTIVALPLKSQVTEDQNGFVAVEAGHTIAGQEEIDALDDSPEQQALKEKLIATLPQHTSVKMTHSKLGGEISTGNTAVFSQYNIVIDEVHVLFNGGTGYLHAKEALYQNFIKRGCEFQNLVLLSATLPDEVIEYILPNAHIRQYSKPVLDKVSITNSLKEAEIRRYMREGVFIYVNNRLDAEAWGKMARDEVGSSNVGVYHSAAIDNPTEINTRQPKVVITTSKLLVGFSIDYRIENVVIYTQGNNMSPMGGIDVTQALGRVRDCKTRTVVTHGGNFRTQKRLDYHGGHQSIIVPSIQAIRRAVEVIHNDRLDGDENAHKEQISFEYGNIAYSNLRECFVDFSTDDANPDFKISEVGVISTYVLMRERVASQNAYILQDDIVGFDCELEFREGVKNYKPPKLDKDIKSLVKNAQSFEFVKAMLVDIAYKVPVVLDDKGKLDALATDELRKENNGVKLKAEKLLARIEKIEESEYLTDAGKLILLKDIHREKAYFKKDVCLYVEQTYPKLFEGSDLKRLKMQLKNTRSDKALQVLGKPKTIDLKYAEEFAKSLGVRLYWYARDGTEIEAVRRNKQIVAFETSNGESYKIAKDGDKFYPQGGYVTLVKPSQAIAQLEE